MRVAVLFRRFGPYHYARLSAARGVVEAVGIELSQVDTVYDWEPSPPPDGCSLVSVLKTSPELISFKEIRRGVWKALDKARPEVVAIPGWSGRWVLAAWVWCVRNGLPIILMSESTPWDAPRIPLIEKLKARIVKSAGAELVGGRPHQEYLKRLGMREGHIYFGYDVVDNQHFATRADAARARRDETRRALGLPQRYFLASGRFIAKKNFDRLMEAYARYRVALGEGAWRLVILGDGRLRNRLEGRLRSLGLGGYVYLPGFKQYSQLPAYYGLAQAFIHSSAVEQWGLVVNEAMAAGLPVLVSERCGCAPDLVEEGRNGFTFDPYDVEALAGLMVRLSSMSDQQRQPMGQASREIISRWTPQTFAENLVKAVEAALEAPPPKARLSDKALLWALAHRPRAKE